MTHAKRTFPVTRPGFSDTFTFPFTQCTPLLPSRGLTKGAGMRSVNGLRSATVAAGADGPSSGTAQMPTATIVARTASATSPAVIANIHSSVTRHQLSCAGRCVNRSTGMGRQYTGQLRYASSLSVFHNTCPKCWSVTTTAVPSAGDIVNVCSKITYSVSLKPYKN